MSTDERPHNQRRYDGKAPIIAAATTVTSTVFAALVWLDGYITSRDELEAVRNYVDYRIYTLELDAKNEAIDRLETQIEKGEALTPAERRRLARLIKEVEKLREDVDELGALF